MGVPELEIKNFTAEVAEIAGGEEKMVSSPKLEAILHNRGEHDER